MNRSRRGEPKGRSRAGEKWIWAMLHWKSLLEMRLVVLTIKDTQEIEEKEENGPCVNGGPWLQATKTGSG